MPSHKPLGYGEPFWFIRFDASRRPFRITTHRVPAPPSVLLPAWLLTAWIVWSVIRGR